MARTSLQPRDTLTTRSSRTRWYTRPGGSVAAKAGSTTRLTLLRLAGMRARPNPVAPNVVLYDYPLSPTWFELAMCDARTGQNIAQVTLGRGEIPHLSNGNGAWSPDGQFIVFQVQAGTTPYIPTGRDAGYGSECDFWAYRLADGALTQLTSHTLGIEGQTVRAWFQPMFISPTQIMYTFRYADLSGTEGTGRWQLRVATWTVTNNVPALSNDVVYCDPFTLGWGYYIVNMGLFPATHPTYPNRVLVAGTLDYQQTSSMKIYAVNTTTKIGPIAPVHPNAWEEGCSLNPITGEIAQVSNGTGLLMQTSDLLNEPTTREIQIIDATGTSYDEITSYNLPGSPSYGGPVRMAANLQHSSWSPDGRTLYAGLVVDAGGPGVKIVTNYCAIRIDR